MHISCAIYELRYKVAKKISLYRGINPKSCNFAPEINFILKLTNGGSKVITWWPNIKWAGGTAPTLTTAGVDNLGFYTHDGGASWQGLLLSKDSK